MSRERGPGHGSPGPSEYGSRVPACSRLPRRRLAVLQRQRKDWRRSGLKYSTLAERREPAPAMPKEAFDQMDSEHDYPSLLDRLERLERSQRRIKTAALCVLVGAAALALIGTAISLAGPLPSPGPAPTISGPAPTVSGPAPRVSAPVTIPPTDTVRTRRLEITDGSGNVRASLAALADGTCALKIYDGSRTPRATVSVQSGGKAGVDLFSSAGSNRCAMSVQSDGVPKLEMRGGDWIVVDVRDPITGRHAGPQTVGNGALMGVDSGGVPFAVLNGKRGSGKARLDVWTDGNPRLLLRDGAGRERTVTVER